MTTLPSWKDAEAWQRALKQMLDESGAIAISLHIVSDFGDINYSVGEDVEEEEDEG